MLLHVNMLRKFKSTQVNAISQGADWVHKLTSIAQLRTFTFWLSSSSASKFSAVNW